MDGVDRRKFLRSTLMGATCAFINPLTFTPPEYRAGKPGTTAKPMIKRTLGKTGIELPVVNMGVMRSDNPALVRAALESGMTHLDTAHSYQHGKNESMLGEVLKAYPRDSFVISTKIAASDTPSFLADLDLSLRRLRMDYVDILYIHGAESRDHALSPDALQGLRAAKASGKARHVGVSTHKNEPEVIQAAIDSGLYEVVLTSINFAQDHHEEMKTAIARAAAEGIGIIGMKTMAGGFRDRERTRTVNCKAALKWVLQNPHVTTTIPGMTTFDQLTENATVNTDIVLTEQEKRDLAMARDEGGLYCQACGTCSAACPNGLPIPEIMRAYMYTYGYSDPVLGRELLTRLQVGSDPCYGCNTCRVACVKGFRVAERVSDIARLMTVPPEFLS